MDTIITVQAIVSDSLRLVREQHLQLILGTTDTFLFGATVLFALLTAILKQLWVAVKRDPLTTHSPVIFSLFYFLQDNLPKLSFSILSILLGVRFCNQIIGQEINPFVGVIIGFMGDTVVTTINDIVNKPKTTT